MSTNSNQPNTSHPAADDRPYSTPQLRRYGRLTDVTATVGNMGMGDSGSNMSFDKTSA